MKLEDSIVKYSQVEHIEFYRALLSAASARPEVRNSLAFYPLEDYAKMSVFLSEDGKSGYAVTEKAKLVNVFSSERGRGDELVESAKAQGARHLKAFDGYLPGFYAKHGFEEASREANWLDGGPEVVTMKLIMKGEL